MKLDKIKKKIPAVVSILLTSLIFPVMIGLATYSIAWFGLFYTFNIAIASIAVIE